MMQFPRPAEPPAFTKQVIAMGAPGAKERELWRDYKAVFRTAQHDRCGYCDCLLDQNSRQDVDHYRPKGELHEMQDSEAESKCFHNTPPITRSISNTGYQWLKYTWSNYVYTCKGCNETFKRCLFPVVDGTRSLPLDSATCTSEKELLLWCYGKELPEEHLEFTRDGAISAINNSAHGLATIVTCGLSRKFLRDRRAEKLDAASVIIERLEGAKAANDAEEFADCIEKLKSTGAIHKDFAGVFRIFVMKQLGAKTWNDVLALRIQSTPSNSP